MISLIEEIALKTILADVKGRGGLLSDNELIAEFASYMIKYTKY
jgi:hypothetical protein